MPNLPFTLRQLDVFESLATTTSFRRTAEALGISQASVSNQLKALEEQLGVSLFDRKPGRNPLLLPEGLAFRDDLRTFRRAAEQLASHRRDDPSTPPSVAKFRALVGQGMFDSYIRRNLDAFFARNPNIELEFETQLPFGQLFRAVEQGEFDFALIHQRADHAIHAEFRQIALVQGGMYGHRKFAEGHDLPLSAELLNQMPFILPKATSKQEREVMRNYEINGIHPRHIIGHTQYFDVIAAMLDRGLGIASFSDAILPLEMRDNVICLMPMENWRLLYFRRAGLADERADTAERFLFDSVRDNPEYPVLHD